MATLEAAASSTATNASSVNAADGNIEKISMDERDGRISVVQLVVSVHDRVHLARVIKKLRALTGENVHCQKLYVLSFVLFWFQN